MRCLGLVVAATVILAGCLGGTGDADVTARSLWNEALAQRPGDEAALVGVLTFEASDVKAVKAAGDAPEWMAPFLEGDASIVGDGRAARWMYLFGDPATGQVSGAVVMKADGSQSAAPSDFSMLPRFFLGTVEELNGTVDSTAPARLAPVATTGWDDIVGDDGAWAFTYLIDRIGYGPVWVTEAGVLGSNVSGTIVADAEDGRFVRGGAQSPFSPVPTEMGTFSGTVVAGQPQQHAFTIAHDGHRELQFLVDAGGGQGASTVRFTASGPSGESHSFMWSSGNNQQTHLFGGPSAGEWSVEARLTTGTTLNYDVEVCAVGWSPCM